MKLSKLSQSEAKKLVDIAAEIKEDLQGVQLGMYRTDGYFFISLHNVLKAIASGETFYPIQYFSGQGHLNYPSDPQGALSEMKERLEEYIGGLPDSYGWDQIDGEKVITKMKELHQKLTLAIVQPEVLLYRSKNGELAIKFAGSSDSVKKFLSAFESIMGSNAARNLFSLYEDNPNTLYVAASINLNDGRLMTDFPNKRIRELFCKLLNLDVSLVLVSENSIRIKDRNILEAGQNVATTFSIEHTNVSLNTAEFSGSGLLSHSVLFRPGTEASSSAMANQVILSDAVKASLATSEHDDATASLFKTFIQRRS